MSDSTLPPYTGNQSITCTKCRSASIDSSYRPSQPYLRWAHGDLEEITTHEGNGGECILRQCRNCGWAWLEQTADAPASETTT